MRLNAEMIHYHHPSIRFLILIPTGRFLPQLSVMPTEARVHLMTHISRIPASTGIIHAGGCTPLDESFTFVGITDEKSKN